MRERLRIARGFARGERNGNYGMSADWYWSEVVFGSKEEVEINLVLQTLVCVRVGLISLEGPEKDERNVVSLIWRLRERLEDRPAHMRPDRKPYSDKAIIREIK